MNTALSAIGVTAAKEKQFAGKNIHTVEDLLCFLPRKYKDFTEVSGLITEKEEATVLASLDSVQSYASYGKTPCLRAMCTEYSSGIRFSVTWFRQNYLYERIYSMRGRKMFIAGKVTKRENGTYDITMPSIFEPEQVGGRRIIPVYRAIPHMSTEYLTGKIEKAMYYMAGDLCEPLPSHILDENKQIGMWDAICKLQFPKTMKDVEQGQARLTFNDLLYFALANECANRRNTVGSAYSIFTIKNCLKTMQSLPYQLTEDQDAAVHSMLDIIRSGKRLNALLQGDVGSGKTIVVILMMIAMADNGYQSALLAPTQILASQHYEDLKQIVEPLGYKVVQLRADMKAKERRAALDMIQSGEASFVVGTHSIIAKNVIYHKLALTIVDEEHKFGVQQRADLLEKGESGVHSITMSATPIPRTLAKAIFGDGKQIFTIHTMPNGRKPVLTGISEDLDKTLRFLIKEVRAGHRAYVVCPMIENSEDEKMADVDSVETVYKRFSDYLTPFGVRIDVVTGKMKKAESDAIIERFKRGESDVLISTTVIEVGVNVPSATMMIITNAERFGLSSLHQLRGRVGRSDLQSYCVLMSPKSGENPRLQAMVRTTDGFQIAEEDLKIRGAGDFLGTEQAGDNKYVALMMAYPEKYEEAKSIARKMIERGEDCPMMEEITALYRSSD